MRTRVPVDCLHQIDILELKRDGDNRRYVVEVLLPHLPKMRPIVRQVIRWAYGYDKAGESYEQKSDGSSKVPDVTGNKLKSPAGVGHDWIGHLNMLGGTPDPSGHVWTRREWNRWYRWALIDLGFPGTGWRRSIALQWVPPFCVINWILWNRRYGD